jgi:outer membrane receptor protein involved in Fe transport
LQGTHADTCAHLFYPGDPDSPVFCSQWCRSDAGRFEAEGTVNEEGPNQPAFAGATDDPSARRMLDLTLEELMTSAAKKETSLGESPTAIAVVTREELRRLGVASLPEAARRAARGVLRGQHAGARSGAPERRRADPVAAQRTPKGSIRVHPR